jgi:hypothetical protein
MTQPGSNSPGGQGAPHQTWMRRTEHMELSRLRGEHLPVPAWLRHTRGEPRWPVTLSVLAAIVLQTLLPARFTQPLPPYLLLSLEVALLIGLAIANPVRIERHGPAVRAASIVLIGLAKMTMLVQSAVSLAVGALVIASGQHPADLSSTATR